MVERSSPLAQLKTIVGTVGARPTLATHGVDITTWQSGSFMPRVAVVQFTGTALATISPIDAALIPLGAELWGLLAGEWCFVGPVQMYGGNIVVLDATRGYVVEINDPSPFTRLAIAGSVAGGPASYAFIPMETWR